MDMAPTATTDPAPEPTPELTAAEQLTAAQGLVTVAQAMVDALTNSSTADDAAAAYAALGAAQTALHAANSLPENQIAAKQAKIDALQAQVDQLEIDLAEATKEPDPATAEMIAATAAAATKVEAIGDEAKHSDDDGLGGGDADTDHMIAIERPRSGTEVTITVVGAVDDDPKFVDQMAGLDRGRTMLVRAMEADEDGNVVEEVVIVSTDIEAPTATAFAVDYMLDANPNDATTAVNQSLEINDGNLAMIATTGITATGAGTFTLLAAVEDIANTDEDETVVAFETDATFDGAEGALRCGGSTDCTVMLDADGEITAITGGWIFTPDADVTVDVADGDGYLSYGFWLERTKDANGAVTSYGEVETFAMATGIIGEGTGDSDLAGVQGTATYNGGAVGVYVKNVLDDQANITSATSGHFTADVELNASFGGGGVAANDQFTIGGTITKFALAGGEDNDWGVGLGLADLSGRTNGNEPGKSAPGNSHNNEFSGVATGDSTAAAGSWNGAFWGSSASGDHDMDDQTPDTIPQPVAVTGEFNANFTDGTAAGGFGANKQ